MAEQQKAGTVGPNIKPLWSRLAVPAPRALNLSAPDLRFDGVLCGRKDIACRCHTRDVLCTRDSESHPSLVHGIEHLFGWSRVALWDTELFERFRPTCTRDCEGPYVDCQDFPQLRGHFIRAYHRTQLDDTMP